MGISYWYCFQFIDREYNNNLFEMFPQSENKARSFSCIYIINLTEINVKISLKTPDSF